jgi:uncharacterized membrane protein HdeD (DUF308 family)
MASVVVVDVQGLVREAGRWWWMFVVSGLAWLLVAVIIFRFDYASVAAIAVLFGILAIFAGLNELAMTALVSRGWKLVHGAVGAIFIVIGVVAFFKPGGTFVALAAVMSFFFVIKGTFDVVVSVLTREVSPMWWLQLGIGIAELLLGFWAAGSWRNSAVVLVAWAGAMALTRGMTELVIAFRLYELQKDGIPVPVRRRAQPLGV